jgi:hypothetical protein
MINILTIQTPEDIIMFGMPSTSEEYTQMMNLRYQVYYEELQYSSENLESDKDYFDKNGTAHYIIAKIGETVVGTVRMIIDEVPPMSKFYQITDPTIQKKLQSPFYGFRLRTNIIFHRHYSSFASYLFFCFTKTFFNT